MIVYDSINNSFIIERELSTLLLHTRLMFNETIRNSRWPPPCNNINILPLDDGVILMCIIYHKRLYSNNSCNNSLIISI